MVPYLDLNFIPYGFAEVTKTKLFTTYKSFYLATFREIKHVGNGLLHANMDHPNV